mgnify:CR=1 FL=1
MKGKPSAYYTIITDLDKEVVMLCNALLPSAKANPAERIRAAEAILMLQHDRVAIVQEIKAALNSNQPRSTQ